MQRSQQQHEFLIVLIMLLQLGHSARLLCRTCSNWWHCTIQDMATAAAFLILALMDS
jgi:hypothetical protein